MAANNQKIWRDLDLENAIQEARRARLHLPPEWTRLSSFARLIPRSTDWRSIPGADLETFFENVQSAVSSPNSAIVWSGWFILVDTLHRIQGILRTTDGPARRLLEQARYRPPLLYGAEFECGLIWLGVQSLKGRLPELDAQPEAKLFAVATESYNALLFFRQFQPEWHPGQSAGLNPYVDAQQRLLELLTTGDPSGEPVRLISAEFELPPYLNLLYDFSFHLGKRLQRAAYQDKNASVADRRKALELSGLWEISAWAAYRGRRRWEEERNRRKGERYGVTMAETPINQDELLALDFAIKGFRAAGWEQTAAALASLLTSYVLIDRPLRVKGKRNATPEEHDNYFRNLRRKYGQLVKQLGFELVGGYKTKGESDALSPEAEQLEAALRAKRGAAADGTGAGEVRMYQSLHEGITHMARGEEHDWHRLLAIVETLPSVRHLLPLNGRKLPLFRLIYYALVPEPLYKPIAPGLPHPDAVRQELHSFRRQAIPVMFRLCLRQWRLRWAVSLLGLEDSGLNASHLGQFLYRWKLAMGSAPEFISFQTEFHQHARAALSQHCDSLDENIYFEALELLHSPVLTMLDTGHCSADELFDRWTKQNLHTLALGTGVDRRRIGLAARTREGVRYGSRVRLPSLHSFAAALQDIRQRTGRRAIWISFIEAGTDTRPEVLGLTLSDEHAPMHRWRITLKSGSTIEEECKSYIKGLGYAMVYGKPPIPPDAPRRGQIEAIVDALLAEIGDASENGGIILLSGPPALNVLPWRWLLKSRASAVGLRPPPVFIVPGASWLLGRQSSPSEGTFKIREGHGYVTSTGAEFRTTAVVSNPRASADFEVARKHFSDLRSTCQANNIVVEKVCFAGHTDRWRACEWNGNPAVLLLTSCRLLVAPPCEIPMVTADRLGEMLLARKESGDRMDAVTVVAELDRLASGDPAAWIYNLYGTP